MPCAPFVSSQAKAGFAYARRARGNVLSTSKFRIFGNSIQFPPLPSRPKHARKRLAEALSAGQGHDITPEKSVATVR
jgi:hypothetical protein